MLNKEQLAVLTDAERRGPYGCECGHSLGSHTNDEACKGCPCPRFVGGLDASELQTALADARLEVARLTEERERTMQCFEISSIANDTLLGDSDQQREDIRRLMEGLGNLFDYVMIEEGGFKGEQVSLANRIAALLAEMKERYA